MNDEEQPRKRYIPVPIDFRLLEEKPLKKAEIMKIRNNLDELVDIKKLEQEIKSEPEIVTDILHKIENKSEFKQETEKKLVTPNFLPVSSSSYINQNINQNKTPEIKIGLENSNNIIKIDNNNKPTKKIIRRKVNYMSTDEEQKVIEKIYNVSPEQRKRDRKADYAEIREEEEINKAIKSAAELAEQNRKELADLKSNLVKDREDLKTNLSKDKEELTNKFSGKFNEITGKLEETCKGIDCLKNDFAAANKRNELSECPECGEKIVPMLASYCPNCSAKISGWTEDDGTTPIKNWKPSWNK